MYKNITELAQKRIAFFLENLDTYWFFYTWHQTYIDALKEELEEVEEEMKENNSVYLEDELWDVFWDYICLLHSLEQEGKITNVWKVFERCYKKFSERINIETWANNQDWKEVKKVQKDMCKKEHQEKYWNI